MEQLKVKPFKESLLPKELFLDILLINNSYKSMINLVNSTKDIPRDIIVKLSDKFYLDIPNYTYEQLSEAVNMNLAVEIYLNYSAFADDAFGVNNALHDISEDYFLVEDGDGYKGVNSFTYKSFDIVKLLIDRAKELGIDMCSLGKLITSEIMKSYNSASQKDKFAYSHILFSKIVKYNKKNNVGLCLVLSTEYINLIYKRDHIDLFNSLQLFNIIVSRNS